MKYKLIIEVICIFALCSLGYSQARNYEVVFPSTPETLATNVASWNFTGNAAYPGGSIASTPSPTFIARGQSSASDHSILTQFGVDSYRIVSANLSQADFGFYLMNLDFQDVDLGVDKVISYSFKIFGNDTNDGINPSDWQVKYATDVNVELVPFESIFETLIS